MIRLRLFKTKLLVFLILLLIGFISSCGVKKKQLREKLKYQEEVNSKSTSLTNEEKRTEASQNSNLSVQTETRQYGDTLKGSQPIDSNGFDLETGGIKLKANIEPVKDKQGNVKGYRLNYNITAKPIAKTNTNSKLNNTATTKEAANIKTQSAKENKATAQATINRDERETYEAFSFPGWVYALLSLIALIAMIIFFKPIINFIKSWKILS